MIPEFDVVIFALNITGFLHCQFFIGGLGMIFCAKWPFNWPGASAVELIRSHDLPAILVVIFFWSGLTSFFLFRIIFWYVGKLWVSFVLVKFICDYLVCNVCLWFVMVSDGLFVIAFSFASTACVSRMSVLSSLFIIWSICVYLYICCMMLLCLHHLMVYYYVSWVRFIRLIALHKLLPQWFEPIRHAVLGSSRS